MNPVTHNSFLDSSICLSPTVNSGTQVLFWLVCVCPHLGVPNFPDNTSNYWSYVLSGGTPVPGSAGYPIPGGEGGMPVPGGRYPSPRWGTPVTVGVPQFQVGVPQSRQGGYFVLGYPLRSKGWSTPNHV